MLWEAIHRYITLTQASCWSPLLLSWSRGLVSSRVSEEAQAAQRGLSHQLFQGQPKEFPVQPEPPRLVAYNVNAKIIGSTLSHSPKLIAIREGQSVDWVLKREHPLPQEAGIESASSQLLPQSTWQSPTPPYRLPPNTLELLWLTYNFSPYLRNMTLNLEVLILVPTASHSAANSSSVSCCICMDSNSEIVKWPNRIPQSNGPMCRVVQLSLLIGAFWVLLHQVLHQQPIYHGRPEAT